METPDVHHLDELAALTLLGDAHTHNLATVVRGAPVLRPIHAVLAEGWLCFHSRGAGAKQEALGQQAVIGADDLITEVPSYFRDAERGCAAGTLYQSAQLTGRLEEVRERETKLRLLEAMMSKHQPEGRYTLPTPGSRRGQAELDNVLVAGLRLEDSTLSGRANLARQASNGAVAKLVAGLWERGRPGDLRAIAMLREERPALELPETLAAPARAPFSLHAMVPQRASAEDLEAVLGLVRDVYWNAGRYDDATLAATHRNAVAWVIARATADAPAGIEEGEVVATARATGDRHKFAYVGDVVVHPALRGAGLGKALVALLLDHPGLRDTRQLRLATRDAQTFYRPFGFVPTEELELLPQMVYRR